MNYEKTESKVRLLGKAVMNYLYGENIKNENNNAGFSLIEIIVVVLLIAIAAGAAVMSLSAALRANTTRAATELSAVISEARRESMTRPEDSVELRIYKSDDDGKYYADIVMTKNSSGASASSGEKLIESKAIASGAVSFSASGTGASSSIKDGDTAVIKFQKRSGKLSSFKVNGTGSGYSSIVISGAKTSTVKISKYTGRSYVE